MTRLTMDRHEAERDRQALTLLAQTLTQAEWDRRFPPQPPRDADPDPEPYPEPYDPSE